MMKFDQEFSNELVHQTPTRFAHLWFSQSPLRNSSRPNRWQLYCIWPLWHGDLDLIFVSFPLPLTEKWGNQGQIVHTWVIDICLYVTIWIFAIHMASGCCRIPLFRGKAAEFLEFFLLVVSLRDRHFFVLLAKNWIRLEDFGPLRGSMSPWWHVWWALHARIPKEDVGMEGFILIKSTAPSPP